MCHVCACVRCACVCVWCGVVWCLDSPCTPIREKPLILNTLSPPEILQAEMAHYTPACLSRDRYMLRPDEGLACVDPHRLGGGRSRGITTTGDKHQRGRGGSLPIRKGPLIRSTPPPPNDSTERQSRHITHLLDSPATGTFCALMRDWLVLTRTDWEEEAVALRPLGITTSAVGADAVGFCTLFFFATTTLDEGFSPP